MPRRYRWLGSLICVILLPFPLLAQAAPAVADSVRTPLLDLERRWDEAIVQKDVTTLEQILGPGFLFVDVDGSITTRADLLQNIRNPELIIDPFTTRDVEVRVYDRTAVLTGWFDQTGSFQGKRFRVRARYTDVYVRDATRWIAVTAHASPLPGPVAN